MHTDYIFSGEKMNGQKWQLPATGKSENKQVGSMEEWTPEQENMLKQQPSQWNSTRIAKQPTGLVLYKTQDEIYKIIVPPGRRQPLFDLDHKRAQHKVTFPSH